MALEIRRSPTVEAEHQRSRIRVLDNNVNATPRLRDDEAPRAVEGVRHTRKHNAGQVDGGRRRGAGFDGDIRMYDQAHVLAPVLREEAAARRHDGVYARANGDVDVRGPRLAGDRSRHDCVRREIKHGHSEVSKVLLLVNGAAQKCRSVALDAERFSSRSAGKRRPRARHMPRRAARRRQTCQTDS